MQTSYREIKQGGYRLLSDVKMITLENITVDLTCSSDGGRKKYLQNLGENITGIYSLGDLRR